MEDRDPEEQLRFRRLREVVEEALSLPKEEWGRFVEERCGGDAALHREALGLLAHASGERPLLDGRIDGQVTLRADLSKGSDAWKVFLSQLRSRGPAYRRYSEQEEVGRGGMGSIHRVYDQDLRRELAVKRVLPARGGTDPSGTTASLGRFLEEAQVTGQLDHPGVVPVHELGVDESDRVYFTMKLVRGEDLRSVFDRVLDPNDDGWNPTRALSVLLRVCEAMAYAHSKGVVHRDLKPSNIMVGKYGETYVMDWGLARVLGQKDQKDLRIQPSPMHPTEAVQSHRKEAVEASPDSPLITMDGDVVGTPAYMSPEQARGELERIGPQSDVYALGTMLYHLLTGHMPYVQPGIVANQHAIWRWVQEGPPMPLHKAARYAPPELTAICDKAMSRSLEDRYANMEALAVDLRAYLENRVVAAYESGAFAELKKWIVRNQGLTATAAAGVLLLAALTAWFVHSVQSERNTALVEKDRADRNAEEIGRLADVKTLADLKNETSALWPAHPDRVQPMKAWLGRAAVLLDRLPLHERTLQVLRGLGAPAEHPRAQELADLRERAAVMDQEVNEITEEEERTETQAALDRLGEQIASLEATLRREQPYEFEDEKIAWWHETLAELVSGLTVFAGADPFGETVASVGKRLAFAEAIQKNSITYFQEEWNEAIASIADQAECPQYNGLEIQEQLGLVPIGLDPDSGLWEFWHVQTGERPERDEDDKLVLTEETGLVFVLIPGGTFWMGAQAADVDGRNYDPQAESNESHDGSPVAVTLDAYCLSKFELTQGQWQRCTGSNPSNYAAGSNQGNHVVTLLHPVEQVSWDDCVETLARLDLRLPTEAQWEYGCRAGTATPWWTGREKSDLQGAANLVDQYCKANGGPAGWYYEDDLNDGFTVHAPVGRYRANAFGLHDVTGNVWEWCLDDYGGYENAARPADGRREFADASIRVIRGGSFYVLAIHARSALRSISPPVYRSNHLGARPVRPIIAE